MGSSGCLQTDATLEWKLSSMLGSLHSHFAGVNVRPAAMFICADITALICFTVSYIDVSGNSVWRHGCWLESGKTVAFVCPAGAEVCMFSPLDFCRLELSKSGSYWMPGAVCVGVNLSAREKSTALMQR